MGIKPKYKSGDKVLDIELNDIVTIEFEEYENGWYYLCAMPNGAVGYRYEHELKGIVNE